MGLIDLLSVVLGVRAADALKEQARENQEAEDETATSLARTRATVDYVYSPAFEAEIRAKFEADNERATTEMLMAWGHVAPARRVRPDLRTGDDVVDDRAGAEREVYWLTEDVGNLYTAALVGGSYERWRRALSWRPDDNPMLSEPVFQAYTDWVKEFRTSDAALLDELIRIGTSPSLGSSDTMNWSREGLGLS
jgi:hypothetical protein